MKKIFVLFILTFMMMGIGMLKARAEEDIITYPFDQIVITEAYCFDIEITIAPSAQSFLADLVEIGDIITIYVGKLRFDDAVTTGLFESLFLILKDEEDTILVSYLNNSFSTDLQTYSEYGFGNWMTIDPEVGVIKDFTISPQYELTLYYEIVLTRYAFIDNTEVSYPMIPNSYQYEMDLNIIVKAYQEVI